MRVSGNTVSGPRWLQSDDIDMIFYFSGTGNSKWIADKLSETLSDRIISVGDAIVNNDFSYSVGVNEKIGWVFPIYSWGPAPVLLDFISKVTLDGYDKDFNYCYMVCSCGDDIGYSADIWRKALRKKGVEGNAAFSVQMPNNYILLPGFDVDTKEVQEEKLKKAPVRLSGITERINGLQHTDDVTTGSYKYIKSRLIYPLFRKFGISDKAFAADSKCNGCGLCERNCPVKNISLESKLPVWHGNCTMCLSCIHRCPVRAIDYGSQSVKKGRYCHR